MVRSPVHALLHSWLALAAVPAVTALALLPATAGAATPASVTFTDTEQRVSANPGPGNTFDVVALGSSAASGALNGTFQLADQTTVAPGGNIHVDRTLTDGSGTISIRIDGNFTGGSELYEYVEGYWAITAGTGAYASLAGSGSYQATITKATHSIAGELDGFAESAAS